MWSKEQLDQAEKDYRDFLASQGKSPSKPGGKRGAYNYQKKEPSARTVARRKLQKDIEEGVPEFLLVKEYDSGLKCPKCTSTMRYISSGSCSGCHRRLDLRTKEDIANGVEALNERHQATLNRKYAKFAQEKRFEGLPCKKCNSTTKYTASGACVHCTNANTLAARQKEASRFHHPTSKLMFVEGVRAVPDVYALLPTLAAYPGYVLVFTDQVSPKRLIGQDALLSPDVLAKYAHLFNEKVKRGQPVTEEEQIVHQYLNYDAMQLAWKHFNQSKIKRGN